MRKNRGAESPSQHIITYDLLISFFPSLGCWAAAAGCLVCLAEPHACVSTEQLRLAAETAWLRPATMNLQTAPRDCWQCETAGLILRGPGQLAIRDAGCLLEADEGLVCTTAYTPSIPRGIQCQYERRARCLFQVPTGWRMMQRLPGEQCLIWLSCSDSAVTLFR